MKDDLEEDEPGPASSCSGRNIVDNAVSYGNLRASRNLAEKQRRDNLNANISTIATLVPAVAANPRRMDKISILRLAAAYLRIQYTLGPGVPQSQFNDFDLEQYFSDTFIGNGGFFIVMTSTGKIVYISRQVEQHLGHAPIDLLGQSLYDYVHPDDHTELTRNITPDEMQPSGSMAAIKDSTADNNSNSSDDTIPSRSERRPSFQEKRRSFKIQMSQRAVSRREHPQYECIHLSGVLRLAEALKKNEANGNRRQRENSTTSNDIIFVGVARLLKKRTFTELSLVEANRNEYVTRHLLDGRIIYCDHRISVVAGYLSEEVSGRNAFQFMHAKDCKWTAIELRQMYVRGESFGSSCYRLRSKNGEYIFLRTHGYLEFDKTTKTVVSFVCVNMLVSSEEGTKLMKEMKERFSATITNSSMPMIEDDEQDDDAYDLSMDSQASGSKGANVEDPAQIEDLITHLIGDLPSPTISKDSLSSPLPDAQYAKAAIYSQRLPSAAAQATQLGIKNINQYLVVDGNDSSVKHEPASPNNAVKHDTIASKEQPPVTAQSSQLDVKNVNQYLVVEDSNSTVKREPTSPSVKMSRRAPTESSLMGPAIETQPSSGKPTVVRMRMQERESRNAEFEQICHASPYEIRQDQDLPQEAKSIISDNSMDSYESAATINRDMMVNETFGQSTSLINDFSPEIETCKVKFERTGSRLKNGLAFPSDSSARHQFPLKRMCMDDEVYASSNKRRPSEMSYSGASQQQAGRSSGGFPGFSRTFVSEDELIEAPVNYNPFEEIRAQTSSIISELPSTSLHDANVDYQQLNIPTPLIGSKSLNDQFAGIQNLKDGTLLSSDLDQNPDLMMKILDNLRSSSFDKTLENDERHLESTNAIDEEIMRTHFELENSSALRESQFNVLARDLENPALQAQRENFTQIQAEHKIHKKLLKTLQQEHKNNMQINAKHNIGV
ncbi:neuronal PAS domain-containing protein 2-like isoform X2 [Prorops nasuta]|uniref:neuronal PAS domain-containing protein 2-like isoform X2 n=1 Tax=Prorops nasuta TaxID=863751 RepID=UPI0034CD73C4